MSAAEIFTYPPGSSAPLARFVGVNPLLLTSFPRLKGLADEDVGRLATATECQLVPEGTTLFRQDDCADAVYLILDGVVALERRDSEATMYSHEIVGPYTTFGDVAMLGEPRRYYTASTRSETVVMRAPLDLLKEVLSTYPDLTNAWIHAVSAQIERKEKGLAESLTNRIAAGLSTAFDAA